MDFDLEDEQRHEVSVGGVVYVFRTGLSEEVWIWVSPDFENREGGFLSREAAIADGESEIRARHID